MAQPVKNWKILLEKVLPTAWSLLRATSATGFGEHIRVLFNSFTQVMSLLSDTFGQIKNMSLKVQFSAKRNGQPREASTRKVKPFWILTKQDMMEWQWHQLDHMQIICIPLQTDNHASTSSPNCLQDTCSS